MAKTKRIFLTILIFLFFTVALLTIFISGIDDKTEKNTTLYSATINDIFVSNAEKKYAEIYINEYSTNLYISTNICEKISVLNIAKLKKGDVLFFRIENTKIEQLNKVEFVDIVSLNTENETIFSLEDYNKFINETALPTRVFCFVTLLILIFLIFFVNKKGDSVTQGDEGDKGT